MIKKILHYVWVGGNPIPQKIKDIMENNKNKLGHEWEIRIWTDKDRESFTNDAVEYYYEKRLWAFVSDYVRAWAVDKYGGFYIDTDIVLSKSLDSLLKYDYVASRTLIVWNTMSIFGSLQNSTILQNYMKIFKNKRVYKKAPRLMSTHFHTYALLKEITIPSNNKDYIENDIAVFAEDLLQIKANERNIAIHEHHKNWKGNNEFLKKTRKNYSEKLNYFLASENGKTTKSTRRKETERTSIIKKLNKYASKV